MKLTTKTAEQATLADTLAGAFGQEFLNGAIWEEEDVKIEVLDKKIEGGIKDMEKQKEAEEEARAWQRVPVTVGRRAR